MDKIFALSFTLLFTLFSSQVLADRENDMWQQFKAQKAMNELDAEFNKPAPAPEPKVVERVVERVRIVEKPVPVAVVQPAPVVAPTPVSTPSASQPLMVTAESEGYIFNLGACKLTHRNIKCQLTITSVDTDGELALYANYSSHSSKLYDHNGNEYQPSSIVMGNKTKGTYIKNKYISGVVAKGKMDFVNVDKSTNSISMIELSIHNYVTNKPSRIKFRNVPLSL